MQNVTLTGAEASLRWSYHQAAVLRDWSVSRDEFGTLKLSAAIVKADTWKLSQQPLVFVVTTPTGSCRWPVIELQNADGTLYASLGPKES